MRVCWKIQVKSIKQAFTDRIIPDEMFTTTTFELESLRHIRPVTNIRDDINDFQYEITNNLRKTLEVAQAVRRGLWTHWINKYLVNSNFL